MNRILASLSITALLAAPAAAQCLTGLGAATSTGVVGDDSIGATHFALGLTYPNPVGGALAGGYTHVRVCTNGWLMLTDGTLSTGLPGGSSYGSTSNTTAGLGGGAGSFPLIAPYWGDANIVGAGNSVYVLAGVPGVSPAEITWSNTSDFGSTTIKKTVKVKIYDDVSGTVEFEYGTPFANAGTGSVRYIGVSTRNGIATVPAQTQLGVGGASSGTSGMCFKTFPTGAINLADHAIRFTQNGTGGWDVANICGTPLFPPPASVSVGTGCYTIPAVPHDTFYQQFNDFTSAATALTGNSLTMVPISSPPGYAASWNVGGGAAYFPPTSATGTVTSLAVSDDGSDPITPSVAMASPFGAIPALRVSHNGILTLGTAANQGTDFSPTGAEICTFNGAGAFYSWADFRDSNTVPVASGVIKYYEETVGPNQILYVTWDAVDRWSNPQVTNANTWQFQANLTTGQVDIVWALMSPNSTSTFTGGNNCVVGYSAPGVSGNPGSIDLATALPIVTFPDVPAVAPMAMTVNSLPIVTLPSGDTVPMTWTVTNVPEATQIGAMVRACNVVFSIAPAFVGGYDLGSVITAVPSGCTGYVATADAFVDVSAINGTGICTSPAFVFSPPPSLIGAVITTQAIALAPAGVYAGFTNDIGGGNSLWSSNAVQQTYNPL